MTVSICTTHKPTGFKMYQICLPKKGTVFNEMFVYERLIEILELCDIGLDKQPLDLIDSAKYESEFYIVQVEIYEGHNIFVV